MKINEKGFMLLSAVFLTLIVSFVAMMTLQTMTRAKNSDASLQLQAINLANEQFALLESGSDKEIPAEDLINYGLYYEGQDDEDNENYKPPTVFEVNTTLEKKFEPTPENPNVTLYEYKVTVTWNNESLEFKKVIRQPKRLRAD